MSINDVKRIDDVSVVPGTESPQPGRPRAVVLLSGGVDSTTTLAIAGSRGFSVYALSVNYGQRHEAELDAARRVAAAMRVSEHRMMNVDLRCLGGSALTDTIEVPAGRTIEEMSAGIPVTYVPARNTILLSCALAYAESVCAFDIFVGVNALDYAGYPDCRPEYLEAFERMANLATRQSVESGRRISIHAPLIHMTKADIIRCGLELKVDYSLTISCYQPSDDHAACGVCDACQLRADGFAEVGFADPAA